MKIYQVKITLVGSKPPIWRRVALSGESSLGFLHDVVQAVMPWDDDHLHEFGTLTKRPKLNRQSRFKLPRALDIEAMMSFLQRDRRFGPTRDPMGGKLDTDAENEDRVTLQQVCPEPRQKLRYTYDFGDSWEHDIVVEKIIDPVPGVKYPICLAGARAAPPEDCGGIYGYYSQLSRRAEAGTTDDEEEYLMVPPDFDPEAFDLEKCNKALQALVEPARRVRRRRR